MNSRLHEEDLGEPDVALDGFALWVHGRQFPDAHDFWDGNWLSLTARCRAPGCNLWVNGPLLTLGDVARFSAECSAMRAMRTPTAKLTSLEPNLSVTLLAADRIGHVELQIEISPDHLTQRHHVVFQIDQTYLGPLIRSLDAILTRLPIRGAPSEAG